MDLVKQNLVTEKHLPGLGLRIFGKKIRLGKWVGDAVRYVGGAIANKVRPLGGIGRSLAGEIDSITNFVAENIETGFQYIGLNASITFNPDNGDLSAQEQQILNKWLLLFTPYAESLAEEAVKALVMKDSKAMLTGINAVLNKINAIQDHYTVTKEPGLSQTALDQRSYLIYLSFDSITKAIIEGLKQTGLKLTTTTVSFPINQYNFRPLFGSSIVTKVTGENYTVATGSIGSGVTKLPTKGNGTGIITLPGTVTDPIKVTPVKTGTTTETESGTGSEVSTETTKKNKRWFLWVLAAAGGYALAKSSSGKKKNK